MNWISSVKAAPAGPSTVSSRLMIVASAVLLTACATAQAQTCGSTQAQNAPSVSQVIMWSTLTNQLVAPVTASGATFTPSTSGCLSQAVLSVYTDVTPNDTVALSGSNTINNPQHYSSPASGQALSSALSANIAVALSVIPVESPTSGVILKYDETTGAIMPVDSTLGPIFTKRAETIGKGKFYLGVTHQDYHFTSFNGQSLNGLSVLYPGGDQSTIAGARTSVATFNLALDVRLSQDIAFLTYGITDRIDVSLGLPVVHAAVASTAYNGIIYSGSGVDFNNGDKCWCVSTFTPGTFALAVPYIGQSSLSKTGFGDVVLRFKDALLRRPNAALAVGVDLRFPTGDAQNYLGTGATSVKPFMAASYSKPLSNGIILAPHADVGWQFSGRSILGGTLEATQQNAMLNGENVPYYTAPFTSTKGYLPDVMSWGAGLEVALGRHNTVIADVIGNQIGWIHNVPLLESEAVTGPAPTGALQPMTSGLSAYPMNQQLSVGEVPPMLRGSFGQYSGAFGYKARIVGNLVVTFQEVVRFDNNGLTARVSPLYGLGYSF